MCTASGSGTESRGIVNGDQILISKEEIYNEGSTLRGRRTDNKIFQGFLRQLPVNGLRGLPLNEARLTFFLSFFFHPFLSFFVWLRFLQFISHVQIESVSAYLLSSYEDGK